MACHVVKMSQALRKSPSSEKVSYEYFDTVYLRYLFVLYANERYTQLYSNKLKCINFMYDFKYKTKDKSFPFN